MEFVFLGNQIQLDSTKSEWIFIPQTVWHRRSELLAKELIDPLKAGGWEKWWTGQKNILFNDV